MFRAPAAFAGLIAQLDHWLPIGDMLTVANCAPGADGKIDWVSYLHTYGLGTPRVATDIKQRLVWRWDGEAFGSAPAATNLTPGAYPITVNLRYPGQYYDFESGLFYNHARYYDPALDAMWRAIQ